MPVASPTYSFSASATTRTVSTDISGPLAAAASAGRDLVLALNETSNSDPADYALLNYLQSPLISVIATLPAPKPTISGTIANQMVQAGSSDLPFAGVTLGDPTGTSGETISLTILDPMKNSTGQYGFLTETNGAAFSNDGGGNYFIDGAPSLAALQADLQDLCFEPPIGAAGQTETFEIDLQSPSGSTADNENTTVLIEQACFAAGTMIATPAGEVAVESIRVDDLVTTLDGARPVVWIGYHDVDVAQLRDPEGGRLVRVRAGAFGDNLPHRDLLITQEHCLFWNGCLSPARMLVSGRSIVVDCSVDSYCYHHIVLARHGILLAEGLCTESYLDTGNRAYFAVSVGSRAHTVAPVSVGDTCWTTHAAAPLTVDRAKVEVVWRMLDMRADARGIPRALRPALTTDPGLGLLLDDGRTLAPLPYNADQVACLAFAIPAGKRPIRLLSRRARPSDIIGPFVDDRRWLGVAVSKLILRRQGTAIVINAREIGSAGWHLAEQGVSARWTNGAATLDLPAAVVETVLSVHVDATLAYPNQIIPANSLGFD